MPRPLRIQAPGTYHLFAQSVSCRPLFPDAEARTTFLRLVGLTMERHGWHVQSYCLMTTHYHLLVRNLPAPAFLEADEVLRLFARDRAAARRRLEAFVWDGIIAAA